MIIETDKIGEDGARTIITGKPQAEYTVGRGETLNLVYFGTDLTNGGAAGKKRACRIVLNGKGARALFLGFVIGKEDQNFVFDASAVHVKGETNSEIRIKSALFGKSRLDFKGDLIIEKDAQQSDTFLASHSLLMDEGTSARAVPSLEILADDVKAGHAATAGKVNEEDLFYLESRGISRREAEHLLVLGFFEEQLQRVPDIDLRDSLRQAIIKSLPF